VPIDLTKLNEVSLWASYRGALDKWGRAQREEEKAVWNKILRRLADEINRRNIGNHIKPVGL
jgi:hypothetical protein